MQNGKPKPMMLPGITIQADPHACTNENPNGIVIASNMPPTATIQMLSEAIRVIAAPLALKEAAARKTSRAGLTMADGSPARIDETTSSSGANDENPG